MNTHFRGPWLQWSRSAVIGTLYLGVAPQSVLALTSHMLPLP